MIKMSQLPMYQTRFLGIGELGLAVIEQLIDSGINERNCIALDSHLYNLAKSNAHKKFYARHPYRQKIFHTLRSTNLLIVIASLLDASDTISLTDILQQLKSRGVLTVIFASMPPDHESQIDRNKASETKRVLQKSCDTIIPIPVTKLQRHLKDAYRDLTCLDLTCLELTTQFVFSGISAIMSAHQSSSSHENRFNDLNALFIDGRLGYIGQGIASGPHRVITAMRHAIWSSLIERSIYQASKILLCIRSSEPLCTEERDAVLNELTYTDDMRADINYCLYIDRSLGEALEVTIIATGY